MTIKNRLAKLEKITAPQHERKVYAVMYDPITGKVKSGTPELIGMTCEQVHEVVGENDLLVTAVYMPDNGREPEPISTIESGNYSRTVGIDLTKI